MNREEAKAVLYEWQKSMVKHGVPIDTSKVQALRVAIEALSKPIVDITQRDLCADISCTDCPFMQETCKLMDYVAYADRPHGEWIGLDECSVCGKQAFDFIEGCVEGVEHLPNFCPNCGADMRKENK